ncbi:MAG: hypothetical protein LBL05_09955, partial [Synergistaceae bacterium]|nr:hypothetical protein [Synergistaceae bacterium]
MKNASNARAAGLYEISYGNVKEALRSKNKEELLALLDELSERYAVVKQFMLERFLLESGNARKLVNSLLAEICKVTSKPAWSQGWEDEYYLPDYSHLEEQFAELAKKG